MRVVATLVVLVLAAGCSQNASDKKPEQTVAERGLKPVGDPAGQPPLPAGHPPMSPDQAGSPGQPPLPAGHPPMGADQAGQPPADLGGLAGKAPAGWRQVTPSSSMRLAEFALPGYPAGSPDAVLAVFHFGPGQGGGTDANIQRWISQFSQPDGAATQDRTQRATRTVQGMKVSLVDIQGTYNGGMGSNGQAEAQAGYRMLGAVVEAPGGVFFYKLTGPQSTITKWSDSFSEYIGSLHP